MYPLIYTVGKHMEGTPLVNLQYLKDNFGDDPEFHQEMLQAFLDSVPPEIERIDVLLAQGEWEEAGKVAHSIKAPVEILGNQNLLEQVKFIEYEGKLGNPTGDLPIRFHELREHLVKVYDEVRRLMS